VVDAMGGVDAARFLGTSDKGLLGWDA